MMEDELLAEIKYGVDTYQCERDDKDRVTQIAPSDALAPYDPETPAEDGGRRLEMVPEDGAGETVPEVGDDDDDAKDDDDHDEDGATTTTKTTPKVGDGSSMTEKRKLQFDLSPWPTPSPTPVPTVEPTPLPTPTPTPEPTPVPTRFVDCDGLQYNLDALRWSKGTIVKCCPAGQMRGKMIINECIYPMDQTYVDAYWKRMPEPTEGTMLPQSAYESATTYSIDMQTEYNDLIQTACGDDYFNAVLDTADTATGDEVSDADKDAADEALCNANKCLQSVAVRQGVINARCNYCAVQQCELYKSMAMHIRCTAYRCNVNCERIAEQVPEGTIVSKRVIKLPPCKITEVRTNCFAGSAMLLAALLAMEW